MADHELEPLLDYLMLAPPHFPPASTTRTPNTTSDAYSWKNITSVGHWPEFTCSQIMQHYGTLLQSAQIASQPMPDTPLQPVKTEVDLACRYYAYLHPRLRRALRAAFHHLVPQLANLHLTPLAIDGGKELTDILFFDAVGMPDTSPSRCVGIIKVSWKWGSDWGTSEVEEKRIEYRQVLSEIDFYMKRHGARYGFVLTDVELVPLKRLDEYGNVLVARAIPWETRGPGRLTILLGMWYLAMLEADDDDWRV
ncbi:hypothetical protein FQN50_001763 [Emmonsiellopsis sp. PD_5]|nr:hypothetical protein FQN50_001763 [Emmonsiellopsis sp. PD_5]